MQAHAVIAHARPRRMTRSEYDRLVEQGLFENERVELIGGIVVEMSPIGSRHADPIDVLNRIFVRSLGDRAVVRIQQPFVAGDDSEPEPDAALVPPGRYADRHPSQAFLIVEVAETSLDYDRETKAMLYAACGVPEYWIVDVNGRSVEIRDTPGSAAYQRVSRHAPGEIIAPRAFPDVAVPVGELFA
jgi:Uma2 family endonuclease